MTAVRLILLLAILVEGAGACQPTWSVQPGTQGLDSQQQGVAGQYTEQTCKASCVATPGCQTVDFNAETASCWFGLDAAAGVVANPAFNHWVLNGCTESTALWPTTPPNRMTSELNTGTTFFPTLPQATQTTSIHDTPRNTPTLPTWLSQVLPNSTSGPPVSDLPVGLPVNSSPTGLPVDGPATDLPVNSPSTGLPVNSPLTGLPVNGNPVGLPINSPLTDLPVNISLTSFVPPLSQPVSSGLPQPASESLKSEVVTSGLTQQIQLPVTSNPLQHNSSSMTGLQTGLSTSPVISDVTPRIMTDVIKSSSPMPSSNIIIPALQSTVASSNLLYSVYGGYQMYLPVIFALCVFLAIVAIVLLCISVYLCFIHRRQQFVVRSTLNKTSQTGTYNDNDNTSVTTEISTIYKPPKYDDAMFPNDREVEYIDFSQQRKWSPTNWPTVSSIDLPKFDV